MIPQDPVMLLSYLNMQLRDNYDSLAELLASLALSEEDICSKMEAIDYHYDASRNQFV